MTKSESQIWPILTVLFAAVLGISVAYRSVDTSKRKSALLFGGGLAAFLTLGAILKAQYFDVRGWTGYYAGIALFIAALAAAFGAAKAAMGDATKAGKDTNGHRRLPDVGA